MVTKQKLASVMTAAALVFTPIAGKTQSVTNAPQNEFEACVIKAVQATAPQEATLEVFNNPANLTVNANRTLLSNDRISPVTGVREFQHDQQGASAFFNKQEKTLFFKYDIGMRNGLGSVDRSFYAVAAANVDLTSPERKIVVQESPALEEGNITPGQRALTQEGAKRLSAQISACLPKLRP